MGATLDRVTLAEDLAVAKRELSALQARLEHAHTLGLTTGDLRAYLADLHVQIEAARVRQDEAERALAAETIRAREDRAAAIRRADQAVMAEARALVEAMLPLVGELSVLNDRLEALHKRFSTIGVRCPVTAYRPHLLRTSRWLEEARRFVDGR